MAADWFEEFGIGRALTWEPEELRAAYDARCREVHPDSGGEAEDFQRLREAYGELSSPGRRLRHWLQLGGVDPGSGGELPAAASGLFGRLGPLLQRADGLRKRQGEARSALARSLVEREAYAVLPELEKARAETRAVLEALTGRFAEFEERGPVASGTEAAEVARTLLFLEKWEQQLGAAWSAMASW